MRRDIVFTNFRIGDGAIHLDASEPAGSSADIRLEAVGAIGSNPVLSKDPETGRRVLSGQMVIYLQVAREEVTLLTTEAGANEIRAAWCATLREKPAAAPGLPPGVERRG